MEKTIEVMLESQQQILILLNSQSFPHQTSYTPFLEHSIEEKSKVEKSLEVFYETTQQFQNMLDSSSQPNFQGALIQNEEPSIIEMNMELLRGFEQQSQNLMDSRLQHNFQNQLSYSPFQEEPIAKSMKDMIPTQNSVTRTINRLDSIMSE